MFQFESLSMNLQCTNINRLAVECRELHVPYYRPEVLSFLCSTSNLYFYKSSIPFFLFTPGYFKTTSSISCNTSLSSNNTQEWWRLSKCTNPICTNPNPICTNSGQPVLLIYSGRIASKVFSLIASAGYVHII